MASIPQEADQSISIDLMNGPDANAQFLQNIAANLTAGTTSHTWVVPVLPPGKIYFFRYTGVGPSSGGQAVYSFTTRFTVSDVVGGTINETVTQTSTPTTLETPYTTTVVETPYGSPPIEKCAVVY